MAAAAVMPSWPSHEDYARARAAYATPPVTVDDIVFTEAPERRMYNAVFKTRKQHGRDLSMRIEFPDVVPRDDAVQQCIDIFTFNLYHFDLRNAPRSKL